MIDFYIFEHYNVSIKKRGVKMGFQENLRYYREKANLTPTEMAKYLNVAYNTYVGYEVRGREPKYDALCKIADLLNVSTDELLGRENNILGMNEDERLKKVINNLLDSRFNLKDNMPVVFQLKYVDDSTLYFSLLPTNTSMTINKMALIQFINNLDMVKAESFQKLLLDMYFSSMWLKLKQPLSEENSQMIQKYQVKTFIK